MTINNGQVVRATAIFVASVFGLCTLVPSFVSRVSSQGRPPARTIVVDGHEAAAGEVIVRFSHALTAVDRRDFNLAVDADEHEALGADLSRVHSRGFDVQTLLGYLRARADVLYAEPNYVQRAVAIPNDPLFPTLWGLHNLGQAPNSVSGADTRATSAWNVSTGSRANVVAVVDTGIDYTHPDLAPNVWSAPSAFTVTVGGVPVTCAAGTHGFNAITRKCDPADDHNHGTHVSGTIGAAGNNAIGVTGVNWTASIMGAKFLDATAHGWTSDAINAIEFVIQAKRFFGAAANVRVLSNSWAGGAFSQALLDEITKANANGMLFVAAAGNDGTNNTTTPTYPASYTAPNIIAVAATDTADHLASFSNYGPAVHLGAPGVDIVSTTRNNTYSTPPWGLPWKGTSMATPHVSGAAALILSMCTLDTAGVKAAILKNVDVIPALTGWVSTNGRLNVDRALRSCTGFNIAISPSSQSVLSPALCDPGAFKCFLGRASYTVTVSPIGLFNATVGLKFSSPQSGISGGFSPFTGVAGASGTRTLNVSVDSTVPPGTYTFTVSGTGGDVFKSTTGRIVVQ